MKSDLAPPSLRWTHKDNDTPISIKCRKYSGFQAAVNFAKYSFMDYHIYALINPATCSPP